MLLSLTKESPVGIRNFCTAVRHLQEQHKIDLEVYRLAHREWKNRLLHWCLIPVECWSVLLFLWILVAFLTNNFLDSSSSSSRLVHQYDGVDSYYAASILIKIFRLLPPCTTLLLGLLSLVITTKIWIGLVTFLYHIAVLWSCEALVDRYDPVDMWLVAGIALQAWTLAWAIQVGVGHLVFERNLPNIANIQQVSYLAMCQSVLIAWSS
jgi:uncharacterized membrane protein YGL010W